MATIGSGLASFGQSIAGAMDEYHQRHVAADQAEAIARLLGNIGIDEQGTLTRLNKMDGKKQEGVRPVIAPEALELFTSRIGRKREGARGAQEALMRIAGSVISRQLGQDPLDQAAKASLIQSRQSRTKLTDVQIGQALGLIPKVQQPPTGGQVMAEQRAQRRERFTQRKEILDSLYHKNKFLDPEMFLDDSAIKYGKSGMFGFKETKPNEATHVQVENEVFGVKEFKRFREKAEKWKELGKAPAPQITAPPGAMQDLIANPTPEMKAFFDTKYGKGSADTVLNAVQPKAESTPEPEEEENGE